MRLGEILLRTDGDNPGWVNRFMAAIVVVADVGKIHRLRNTRHLVDIAQETIKIGVVADTAFVALKVGHVDRVETHEGCPQTNIGLGQLATRQIAMLAQNLFQALQRGEHRIDSLIISLLAGGEPGFIDAVIDVVVDPTVQRIDIFAQRGRVVIAGGGAQSVKGGIEHADDFSRLITDDRMLLFIPQNRHLTRPV